MSEIKIEKNVPIPEGAGHIGRKPKYPFGTMEIGDSVWVEAKEADRLRNAAGAYRSRHHGWNYVGITKDGKYRVWRTS